MALTQKEIEEAAHRVKHGTGLSEPSFAQPYQGVARVLLLGGISAIVLLAFAAIIYRAPDIETLKGLGYCHPNTTLSG